LSDISHALKRLKSSRQTVALTGAGISAASGIPDFRGADGLWKIYDPSVYAHIKTFKENPAKVWELALKLLWMVRNSEPNGAHYALAEMEKRGLLHGIITQNIDNLHQRAGNRGVINYHGSVEQAVCVDCNLTASEIGESIPVCTCCGRVMKPGFTLFGEAVHPSAFLESRNLASFSDVFLVIGTSAVVQPAADLPIIAKENGAFIIELNREVTGLTNYITDCFLKGPVEETLPYLAAEF
jgi:NAD-dependent deacetylase